MVYILNAFNLVMAALCLTTIAGAYWSKKDANAQWDCPIENSVIATVAGAAVLFILNCFY